MAIWKRNTLARALFDVRFDSWLTPGLVRWLYLSAMAVICGCGLFLVVLFWSLDWLLDWLSLVMVAITVVWTLGAIVFVRVVLERMLIPFVRDQGKIGPRGMPATGSVYETRRDPRPETEPPGVRVAPDQTSRSVQTSRADRPQTNSREASSGGGGRGPGGTTGGAPFPVQPDGDLGRWP